MRTVFSIVMTVVSLSGGTAAAEQQKAPLSARAERLKTVYDRLKDSPADSIAQVMFLQEFPRDKDDFKRTFYPADLSELYDGYEYIEQLTGLSKDRPIEVGNILVRVGKDAEHGVDAWGYLRQAIVTYATENTQTFADLLSRYTTDEETRLVSYLADVENHFAYPGYQEVIDRLRGLGEDALAQDFEDARAKRMKEPVH